MREGYGPRSFSYTPKTDPVVRTNRPRISSLVVLLTENVRPDNFMGRLPTHPLNTQIRHKNNLTGFGINQKTIYTIWESVQSGVLDPFTLLHSPLWKHPTTWSRDAVRQVPSSLQQKSRPGGAAVLTRAVRRLVLAARTVRLAVAVLVGGDAAPVVAPHLAHAAALSPRRPAASPRQQAHPRPHPRRAATPTARRRPPPPAHHTQRSSERQTNKHVTYCKAS